ncbi:hypothetical protein SK128_017684, partial [Halocaridina rubra]
MAAAGEEETSPPPRPPPPPCPKDVSRPTMPRPQPELSASPNPTFNIEAPSAR